MAQTMEENHVTYTVKKQGHKSWADLLGKHISFLWSDGWEEYSPDMILAGVWMPDPEEQEDSRYPMYYVTEEGGGGYGIRESAVIEVTVHEDKPKRQRKTKKAQQTEQEPQARGSVDVTREIGYTKSTEISSLIDRCLEAEAALSKISKEMGEIGGGVPKQVHHDNPEEVAITMDAITARTKRIRSILKDAGFPANLEES